MLPSEADAYVPSSTINLIGYTSTTKSKRVAIDFAFMESDPGNIPVVFEIQFQGSHGLISLTSELSAYPEEQEVLV